MRYWTSDWHFDHDNIIPFANRPFEKDVVEHFALGDAIVQVPDVNAMNTALIDNTNDLLGVDDELWLIGDAAMSDRKKSLPLFKRLICRNLILVPGNHDKCHPMYPKYLNHVAMYEDAGFAIYPTQVDTMIGDTWVKVCHFPYWGDSQFEDRYTGLRPDDEGSWLIHGHTHSPERVRGRQLHVGVDAWNYKPVSEDTIARIIAGE